METRCAALSITVTVCLRGCFTFEHYPSVFMESMPLTPVGVAEPSLGLLFNDMARLLRHIFDIFRNTIIEETPSQ
ncbi:hypothetical protein C0Q70_03763 [Pomacea canaliculata]|uniref:Uncharacterized protein n=1 Tax=Pomacea canaliculata TaxID=400727 RepID=A0A2T7PTL4_POMCA|nr:hypothetical protein C0Q70_03763 [Pomacea canaliculata]